MRDEHEPDTGTFPVFMRTTDVLMGRVREEMIASVMNDPARTVCLMHLKDGLDVYQKPPRDTTCPTQSDPEAKKDVPGKLSRIRTDLDSFTDVEASCLMARGYTLAETHVDDMNKNWLSETGTSEQGKWFFNRAIPWLTDPGQGPASLVRQLDVAEQKIGKVLRLGFSLNMILSMLAFMVGVLAYLAAVCFALEYIKPGIFAEILNWLKTTTLLDLICALLIVALGIIFEKIGKAFKLFKYLRYPYKFVISLVIRFILPALVAIPVKIYLLTLDKYYVRQGKFG